MVISDYAAEDISWPLDLLSTYSGEANPVLHDWKFFSQIPGFDLSAQVASSVKNVGLLAPRYNRSAASCKNENRVCHNIK